MMREGKWEKREGKREGREGKREGREGKRKMLVNDRMQKFKGGAAKKTRTLKI